MSPGKQNRRGARRGYESKRSLVNAIARDRIQILLGLARTKAKGQEPKLARRYVQLAKKISMRTKVRIPKDEKRFLCKECSIPLIPGLNARVRLSAEKRIVTITCLECQHVARHPYAKEKSRRKTVNPYMTRPPALKEFPSIKS